ncbi:MAG TPA: choice-of-anchor L domain-containing protein, partial [Flavobacterium sp.]
MRKSLLILAFVLSALNCFSQANISVTNTDYQNSYIPGTTQTYTIAVTNFGPNAATNVLVSNPIPAGISYFSWVGSNGSTGYNVPVTNTIANLAVGAIVTYTVTVEVPAAYSGNLTSTTTISSPVADPNTANNVSTDTDIEANGADLSVVNTNNQTIYVPGSTVVYTVTLSNNGPLTAANVQINNAIPAGITQFSWTGSNGSSGTNVPLSNLITSMAADTQVVYTITVQIPASYTGNLTSTTTYSSPTIDPVPGCTQCTDTDTQGFGADIVVVNTDNQTGYVAGETNVYIITVTNNGPGAAANVHVVNAIPAGITSFSWTGSNGSSGTDVALDNTIASLANGQTVTYTITMDVPASYSGNLTSQTVVTSSTTDPNPACAQCTDTDNQLTGADLEIVNTDGHDAYFPGTNVYTITVTNNGPNDATGVHVTNAIPAGITQFSWTGSNGTSGTNVPLDDTIATLPDGSAVVYTLTIQVPPGTTGNLTSTTVVTSTSVDPTPACPQCSDTDVQAFGADLVVTKTDGASTYTAGTTKTYFITITNNGPAPATNVTVSDLVPAGINPTTVTWTGPSGAGSGNINQNFANVAVGQVLSYTVTVPVPANFDQTANLVNTVVVTSTTPDPNPGCPGCTDTDLPFPSANISVLKSDGQTGYTSDTDITYNIVITNVGPSDAVNVAVADALPAGITEMEWEGSNGSSGTGALSDVIANLAVGQVATYAVTIHVPENYHVSHPTLVNTAVVDAETPDPVPACPGCTDSDIRNPNWVTIKPPNTYTPQQLVEDILIHSDCANVSNFVTQLGPGNFTTSYFHRNNSDFPLEEGVIIATGPAQNFQGPYDTNLQSANGTGQGDAQLQAISNANGGGSTIQDVSFIKFNFVPLTTNFSFRFLFASNEYGTFQCTFGDVFAFILTDLDTGVTTNIATIPDVLPPTPISVVTIRNDDHNPGCASVHPEWFDVYNEDNQAAADINAKGQAFAMLASATVIPNHNYTIKLVIGDYQDQILDTAIFIEGGSFNVGQANVTGSGQFAAFPDLTIENGAAVCDGMTTVIQAGASPIAGATYEWEQNGVPIPNSNNYQLTVDEPGIYDVIVSIGSGASGCSQTDSIIVEYLPAMPIEDPEDVSSCGCFDLTETQPGMLNGQDPFAYTFNYHLSEQEAFDVFNEIPNPTCYDGVDGQTIWVSIQDPNSSCIGVREFVLHETICGDPTTPPDLFLCDDASNDEIEIFDLTPQIPIILGGNDPALFEITFHHSPGNANSGANPINASAFTNNQNCDTVWVRFENVNDPSDVDILQFDVCVLPPPTAPNPADVVACESYILPALPAGQSYHENDGTGAVIAPLTAITTSQTIAIVSTTSTTPPCTAEGNFTVTIVQRPAVPTVSDISGCDSVTLPNLPAGQTYHSASGGQSPIGNTINTTQPVWVYAENTQVANCGSEASFTVTINTAPPAPNPADVTACTSYMLPLLPAGQTYHAGTPTGTVIPGETFLTTTQTVVIVAETGTTPNCTSSGDFIVTINQVPPVPTVANVVACDTYPLPALPAGQSYHYESGGQTPIVPAVINDTDTVWVFAQTGTTPNCTSEASFTVTINDTPPAPAPLDVTACTSYMLPMLPSGQTYHAGTPAGVVIPGGTLLTATQTVVIVAETATTPNCTSSGDFIVTINQAPPAPAPQDITVCDSYTLPSLPAGQTYHSASGGNPATVIPAGTIVTTTQTICIFAQSGTTPNCTSEGCFTVTVNQTPPTPVVADVTACDSYTLPALPAGSSYHSFPGGDSPLSPAITTTTQVWV